LGISGGKFLKLSQAGRVLIDEERLILVTSLMIAQGLLLF
jgi:hypothetical protein